MVTILLSILLTGSGWLYGNPTADRLIRQGMQATYNLDLAQARAAAARLQAGFSDHPAGFTMEAETYWWEAMMDPDNGAVDDNYYRAQKLAVRKAEEALKAAKYPRAELLGSLASAHGSHARFQVTQKEAYFSAMLSGRRAYRYAAEAFEIDSMYYDIYVGVGAYNYFTGSLPAVIKPFAFLLGARGDRNLGIEQLRTAIDKGRYAQTEGRIVLYTALMEERQYAGAFQLLEELVSHYKNNFVFYTWAADWFRRQNRNLEGADYFERLHDTQLETSPLMAKYALLETARLQAALGRKADALQTLDRLTGIPANDPLLEKQLLAFRKKL